jgi:ribosome-associated protein
VKAKAKKKAKKTAKKTAAKKTVPKRTASKKTASKKRPAKKAVRKAAKATVKRKSTKQPAKRKTVKLTRKIVKKATPKTPAKKIAKKAAKAAVKPVKKVVAPKKTIHVSAPPKPVYSPLVEAVLKQLDDAKAEQIAVIDLVNRSTMADTMVIASGRSDRHVNAIADQVVETLEKNGLKNLRVEGKPQCDWVLVDSGDIIVHVFRPEVRSFYNLEKLWSPNAPKDQQA